MKKLFLVAAACATCVSVFAESHTITDLAVLETSFFTEGDTIALPAGSYAMMGDAIATVAGNVVTCKKAGFTLLEASGAKYRVCVVPQAPAGGDVFYCYSNNGGNGDNWASVAWTKVTQNTERTYPNNENDIAVIEGGCCWAKLLINEDISLHGYVVGVSRTITSGDGWVVLASLNAKTLTFCGTESEPAFFNLSSMSTRPCRLRMGNENGTGTNVLNINVAAEKMNFDWCGDSASVASPYRGEGLVQWCSAVMTVPAGNTLAFVNDSQKVKDSVTRGNTALGHITGAGTVAFCQRGGVSLDLFKFAGDAFSGDIATQAGEWKGMLELPDASLTVVGAPHAGRNALAVGYDTCSANPGRSQIDVKGITLDGGYIKIFRNYVDGNNLKAWTNGTETAEERAAKLTVTNEIRKLNVKGDSGMLCEMSYGVTRVRQHVILDEIDHDKSGTLCLYDFNFRDKDCRTDTLNYDRVKGPGLAAHAVGRDRQAGDSAYVYKIIPWIACTINDNTCTPYAEWGAHMNFPALVDGQLGCPNGRNAMPFLTDVTEWDNLLYCKDSGITALGGKTINSLSYNNTTGMGYPQNRVLGVGKTLTIKSGGLIMCCKSKWLGATETAYLDQSGSVAFGGDRAYVISDYGVALGTSDEYNTIWSSLVAPNGLTKGGCGTLVLGCDQRGIEGDLSVGGGTLWLGHPANYTKLGWLYSNQNADRPVRGCVTDVSEISLHAGAVLGIPLKGYDLDGNGTIDDGETAIPSAATLRLDDNVAGCAKVEIAAGADQTCTRLVIDGQVMPSGTYGASGSGATAVDDAHFAGGGVLTVLSGESDAPAGVVIIVL